MSKTIHSNYQMEIRIEREESMFFEGDAQYIPSIKLNCTNGFVKLSECDTHQEAYKLAMDTIMEWGK